MSKSRHMRRPMPIKHMIPFLDAEEAWFWFIRSQRARREGARLTDTDSAHTRPCEPDDIYRIVMGLFRRRTLHKGHLRVLAEYGWRGASPDGRVRDEEPPALLWEDALERMTTVLKEKGIISHDERRAQVG